LTVGSVPRAMRFLTASAVIPRASAASAIVSPCVLLASSSTPERVYEGPGPCRQFWGSLAALRRELESEGAWGAEPCVPLSSDSWVLRPIA
jgi:hypothetical protein